MRPKPPQQGQSDSAAAGNTPRWGSTRRSIAEGKGGGMMGGRESRGKRGRWGGCGRCRRTFEQAGTGSGLGRDPTVAEEAVEVGLVEDAVLEHLKPKFENFKIWPQHHQKARQPAHNVKRRNGDHTVRHGGSSVGGSERGETVQNNVEVIAHRGARMSHRRAAPRGSRSRPRRRPAAPLATQTCRIARAHGNAITR